MDSILTSIKKLLGISSEYTQFDGDIIIHINSTFMTLNQLGVGPDHPVFISSEMETWESLLGDSKSLEAVKSYVYLKVKLLFDPPTSSFVLNSIKESINELECRLLIQAEKEE